MAVVRHEDAATAIQNDLSVLIDKAPARLGTRPKSDIVGSDRGAPVGSVWYEPPWEDEEALAQLTVIGHIFGRRSARSKWELTHVVTARGADAFALSTSQAECMLGHVDNYEEEPVSVVLNFMAQPAVEADRWQTDVGESDFVHYLDGGNGEYMPVPDALCLVLPYLEAMRRGVYIGLDPREESEETLCLLLDGAEVTDVFATASEGAAASSAAAARPAAPSVRGRGRGAGGKGGTMPDGLQALADSVTALRLEVQEMRTAAAAPSTAPAAVPSSKGGAHGTDAYRKAIDQARSMLPPTQPHQAPGVAEGATTNTGRRAADAALEDAVARGGDEGTAAIQLETLRVLRQLQGRRTAGDGEEGESLDDLLMTGDSNDHDLVARIQGTKGIAGLRRLGQAMNRDPERWSAHFDAAAKEMVDPLDSGAPVNMEAYKKARIHFPRTPEGETLERMWDMLGCLHTLDVKGQKSLLSAKLRQFLKTIEQVNLADGDWEVPWLLTGLPDPRPRKRIGTGLIHPAEWAANVGHVREAYALEKALADRKGKGKGKTGKDGKDKKGKDGKKGGSGASDD